MGFSTSRYRLGDLCEFYRGASVPRTRMHDSGDCLYIHYGDLYKGFSYCIDVEHPQKPLPYVLSSEKIKDEQRLLDQDIVYVLTSETVDDLGHSFLFDNPKHIPAVAGTETTIVRVKNRYILLPAYLNYLMHSPRFLKTLRQYVRGMKVFRVHPRDVARIEIDLPAIDTQRKTVLMLDAIHEKLLVNARTNGYLADLADAIFKERCTTLEANATLSDIAEVTMGQSPRGSSYNETHDGAVFYQGRGEFGCRFPIQRLYTTEPKRMARKNDVLMSVRAPVGDLNVAYEDCCIGRGLASIHSSYPSFCLYLMRSLRAQLDSYNGEGTVFGSINGKALKALPIGLPDGKAIKDFERLVGPLDEEIRSNETESRNLAALRDSLLPKLMAGEIDVSKVEVPTQPNSHLCDC